MNNYIITNQNPKQQVYNSNGRVVGYIESDTLYKSVIELKHMLRQPPGWAWDVDILSEAERLGATCTVIYAKDTRKTYTASIQDFWDYGIRIDRGAGKQIVCLLKYFVIDPPEQHSKKPKPPPTPPKTPVTQIALPL